MELFLFISLKIWTVMLADCLDSVIVGSVTAVMLKLYNDDLKGRYKTTNNNNNNGIKQQPTTTTTTTQRKTAAEISLRKPSPPIAPASSLQLERVATSSQCPMLCKPSNIYECTSLRIPNKSTPA